MFVGEKKTALLCPVDEWEMKWFDHNVLKTLTDGFLGSESIFNMSSYSKNTKGIKKQTFSFFLTKTSFNFTKKMYV